MDPLSSLFAVFLDQAGTDIGTRMLDAMNTNLETVIVEHEGERVSFQHHLWQVRPQSVCADHRAHIDKFARCTQAAHEVFQLACEELQANPRRHPYYRRVRSMYCAAATNFAPTQASIEWADGGSAEASGATSTEECRLAQAALLSENTPETRAHRKKACGY